MAAEWIKLRSLRSTSVVLGLSALAIVGLGVFAAVADLRNLQQVDGAVRGGFAPGSLNTAFNYNAVLVLLLVAGSVGASAIVSELGTGLVRTTFVAVPDRRAVMAAKAAVVTPVFLVFGAVVSSVSFAVTQAILDGEGAGVSITYPGAWRVIAASTLVAPIAALAGMAIGAVVRHTATAMVATPFLLIVLPTFLTDDRYLAATAQHAMVLPAWRRLTDVSSWVMDRPYPTTVTGSWIVLAVWTLAAAAVAVTVLHRRDV